MRMEGEEQPDNGIGFVPLVGDKKVKHECAYNPFPNVSPYYKRGDTERAFLTLGCQCGGIKEVMVQDLRPAEVNPGPPLRTIN